MDIYDVNTGIWSTANLSQARYRLAAAVAGNKVLFGGGIDNSTYSNVVDIYDDSMGIGTGPISVERVRQPASSEGDIQKIA